MKTMMKQKYNISSSNGFSPKDFTFTVLLGSHGPSVDISPILYRKANLILNLLLKTVTRPTS